MIQRVMKKRREQRVLKKRREQLNSCSMMEHGKVWIDEGDKHTTGAVVFLVYGLHGP